MAAPQEKATPSLFPSMWRYRWMTLAIVVAITLISGVAGYLTRPPATATATIALKSPSGSNVLSPGVVGDASTTRYVEQRAQFATSDAVLGRVANQLGGVTVSDLRQRITVQAITGTNTMTIVAEGARGNDAVTLANTTVDAFRTESSALADDLRRQAAAELTASQDALRGAATSRTDPLAQAAANTVADLQKQGAQLRIDALLFGDGVDFVNSARIETATIPGPPYRDLGVGLVVGLALAALAAWLRADRDHRVTDANFAGALLSAPLLGILPRTETGRARRLRPRSQPIAGTSALAAAHLAQYQLVGAALLRRTIPGVVAVMGTAGSADRYEVSVNVAIAIAADGGRVLVVDADPAAGVTKRLEALAAEREAAQGETQSSDDVLNGEAGKEELVVASQLVPSPVPRPRPIELGDLKTLRILDDLELEMTEPMAQTTATAARVFAERLAADHEKYDMVIVDVPSIETTPLVTALIKISTGILAVVPRGASEASLTAVQRTAEVYSTPVLGFVYTAARGVG